MDAILKRIEWADTVLLGPGLSQEKESLSVIRTLISRASGRLVLDADALNSVSGEHLSILEKTRATCVVTPHVGEFSRLTGIAAKEIDETRIDQARAAARKLGKVVVLKGAPTVTATPEGPVFVNSTGNPGMATVGTGDVLAGIIAALWAQGMDPVQAGYAGVFLHGLCGDLAAEKFGQRSLIASDLISLLPGALLAVEGGE
jgi:NAD(P)H-hydrate epimerase